jgi:hypothetical protein
MVCESEFLMGRSRKRRGAKHRSDKLDRLQREQLRAFKAKFGRDRLPDEPIYFDPDKDVPTEIDLEQEFANLTDSMREAGMRPELIYAYEKTGLILMEGERLEDGPAVSREMATLIRCDDFDRPIRLPRLAE